MRALVFLLVLGSAPAFANSPVKMAGDKSENTAMWLSGGGTVVSGGLILASFLINPQEGTAYAPMLYIGVGTSIITPSLGQLYAGQYLTLGMGIRGASALLALYGASRTQDQPCVRDPMENCPGITGGGLTLISIAAIAYVGGMAFDVRDAPQAVRRYNRKLASRRSASLTPTHNGFAIVGQF